MTLDTAQAHAAVEAALRAVNDEPVPPDRTFFAAGLTSADLVTVHCDLQARLGLTFPMSMLFKYPTTQTLARQLAFAGSGQAPSAAPAPVAVAGDRPDSDAEVRRRLRARIRRWEG